MVRQCETREHVQGRLLGASRPYDAYNVCAFRALG